MSSFNCCFLTCIQVSQEPGQVVWYSHLFQNFPQFIVIHTVEGFGIVNKAEIDVFLELSCFFLDLLELTPKKDVFLIIGDWNAKVGSQETPGVTGKFGLGVRNEAGQRLIRVLPRERTGHSKHPLPTTQEKTLHMDITRWSTLKSDWLYIYIYYILCRKMKKLYTVSKNKTRSWLWLKSWIPYWQIQTYIEESGENH